MGKKNGKKDKMNQRTKERRTERKKQTDADEAAVTLSTRVGFGKGNDSWSGHKDTDYETGRKRGDVH